MPYPHNTYKPNMTYTGAQNCPYYLCNTILTPDSFFDKIRLENKSSSHQILYLDMNERQ